MDTSSTYETASLWAASQATHESGELRFSGFEPALVACIKDLEWRISLLLEQSVGNGEDVGIPSGLPELLHQYTRTVAALSKIESYDRVYEEDFVGSHKMKFRGMRRRLQRARDVDELYERLEKDWILKFCRALFHHDVVAYLKDRFGNLTATLDRVLVGLTGGASLLIPMIIMSFLTDLTARLVVVSLSTIIFATGMALTSVSRENVVAATAGFAAVMVVFIGSAEMA